jgi:hypothetical protein
MNTTMVVNATVWQITDALGPIRQAILEDAIHNYRKYSFARDRVGKEHFHEAEHWIMHSKDHWIFSFENVCDLLGLDPEYLRRGLSDWRATGFKA